MDDQKRLDVLKKSLEVIKQGIETYKDLEISDGDLIKYSSHGQWSLNKEEAPYWSKQGQMKQRNINRRSDIKTNIKPEADTRNIKPSISTKYVDVPGKGRGEEKKMDKEMGGGSLSGSYGMIS